MSRKTLEDELEDFFVVKSPTINENNFVEHMFYGFLMSPNTAPDSQLADWLRSAVQKRDELVVDKGASSLQGVSALNYITLHPKEIETVREIVRRIKNIDYGFLPQDAEFRRNFEESHSLAYAALMEQVRAFTHDSLAQPPLHFTNGRQREEHAFQYLLGMKSTYTNTRTIKAIDNLRRKFNPDNLPTQDESEFQMNVYELDSRHRSLEAAIVRVKGKSTGHKLARKLIKLVDLMDQFDNRPELYTLTLIEHLGINEIKDESRKRELKRHVRKLALRARRNNHPIIPLDYLMITDFLGAAFVKREGAYFDTNQFPHREDLIVVKTKQLARDPSTGYSGRKDLNQTQIRYYDARTGLFYDAHITNPEGSARYLFGRDGHRLWKQRELDEMKRKHPKTFVPLDEETMRLINSMDPKSIREPLCRQSSDIYQRARNLDRIKVGIGSRDVKWHDDQGVYHERKSIRAEYTYPMLLDEWVSVAQHLPAMRFDQLFLDQLSGRGDSRLPLTPETRELSGYFDAIETDYKKLLPVSEEDRDKFDTIAASWNTLREIAEQGQTMMVAASGYQGRQYASHGNNWTVNQHERWIDSYEEARKQQMASIDPDATDPATHRKLEVQLLYNIKRLEADVHYMEMLQNGAFIISESRARNFGIDAFRYEELAQDFYNKHGNSQIVSSVGRRNQFESLLQQHQDLALTLRGDSEK